MLSRFRVQADIDNLPAETINKISASVEFLENSLSNGRSVYGEYAFL